MPTAIAAPFFVFGFSVTARLLDLTEFEILVGLAAGAVAGLAMLWSTLHRAAAAALARI